MPELTLTALDDLTVLAVRGPDALPFLQGQITHDTTLLAARGSLLAALLNPQGRVLALFRLFHVAPDHVLLVLPAELAADVRARLAKYVLRAKVRIEDAGAAWRVVGVAGPDAEAAARTRLAAALDAGGLRQLIVLPRTEALPEAQPADRESWRREDILAGIPEVVAATAGQFVPQMLNLDHLDAVSFSKGCYTGQEVVARAHYLGQVKRRLQHLVVAAPEPLAPGQRVVLADGRSAQVVSAVPDGAGEQLVLAVAGPPDAT